MQEDHNVSEKTRRGRPCFKPDDEKRRIVATMAGNGLSQERIARHFHISVPTLCKYFRTEMRRPARPDSSI